MADHEEGAQRSETGERTFRYEDPYLNEFGEPDPDYFDRLSEYRSRLEYVHRDLTRRRRFIGSLLGIFLGGVVTSTVGFVYLDSETAWLIVGVAFSGAIALGMLQYLSAERGRIVRVTSSERPRLARIENEIDTLRQLISLKSDSTVDYQKIVRASVETVNQAIYEKIINAVSAKYGREIKNYEYKEFADERLRSTYLSLNRQLDLQNRKANLNLVLGALVACVGFGVLGYLTVFGYTDWKNTQHDSVVEFVFWYVPKFAFVVIIEIFSYFFLNLYKAGLGEIKFFQNEIVNLESKIAATNLAFFSRNEGLISEVVSKLASTERNFVLKKGERNVSEHDLSLPRSQIAEGLIDFARSYQGHEKKLGQND